MASLVEPGVDATTQAGKPLENLPASWDEANLTARKNILLSMLNAVYVETVEEKAIVPMRPKPAFRLLLEAATTREGSDVGLKNEPPLTSNEPDAADLCFWWRRGRVKRSIPKFLICHHIGKEWNVGELRFDADKLFTIDGDASEYLLDQRFPLLMGYSRLQPQGWQIF